MIYMMRTCLILQQEDKEFKINWRRVATTSMFGFAFVGPVGHYWYVSLVVFESDLGKVIDVN